MTIDSLGANSSNNIPWQQLVRQESVQAATIPIADYDTQTAGLMGCSESNPMIKKITCHENADGIVAMEIDYFDGRTIRSGDTSLATNTAELSMEPKESNSYVTFIEASRSDTQFGFLKLETNLGDEMTCGVSRGNNVQEFNAPNYVTVNNATRWLLEGMDLAYDDVEGVAVGINFWGMTEGDAIAQGNLHLCVQAGPPARDCETENQ